MKIRNSVGISRTQDKEKTSFGAIPYFLYTYLLYFVLFTLKLSSISVSKRQHFDFIYTDLAIIRTWCMSPTKELLVTNITVYFSVSE